MRRQIPPVSCLVPLAAAVALLAAAAAAEAPVAVNVTGVLSAFPNLSDFTRLLASSPVLAELAGRSSLTLLAVPNGNLPQSPSAFAAASGADLADVLRYHVLLEYLAPADLHRLPASGKLVTTLFQTTGRAPADLGAVNVTTAGASLAVVRSPAPFPGSNATVLGAVTAVPYNLSVLAVNGLIVPSGFDLAASESRPPAAVNITRVLADARSFNVAASMLEASGVAGEFEADERGAGITVFAPTDDAFAGLPAGDRLQSLPADRKAVVLRFHVLHSYYPLGSLESIVNPVQPTLATEFSNAGRFTLNITRANGSVAIDTGVVQATITRTVFDQNPVAVFAVSKVLLPKEMFTRTGGGGADSSVVAATAAASSPPPAATAPEASESVRTPPTKISSPPALRGGGQDYDTASAPAPARGIGWWCIALVYLLPHLIDEEPASTTLTSPSPSPSCCCLACCWAGPLYCIGIWMMTGSLSLLPSPRRGHPQQEPGGHMGGLAFDTMQRGPLRPSRSFTHACKNLRRAQDARDTWKHGSLSGTGEPTSGNPFQSERGPSAVGASSPRYGT